MNASRNSVVVRMVRRSLLTASCWQFANRSAFAFGMCRMSSIPFERAFMESTVRREKHWVFA